jgi:hypothetical protein
VTIDAIAEPSVRFESGSRLLRIPISIEDAVHGTYWRFDLNLPHRSEVIGVTWWQKTPTLLAVSSPSDDTRVRTFLIWSGHRTVHGKESFDEYVRFIDSFQDVAGRLGAYGWKTFLMFEVMRSASPPTEIATSRPVLARRIVMSQMFSWMQ